MAISLSVNATYRAIAHCKMYCTSFYFSFFFSSKCLSFYYFIHFQHAKPIENFPFQNIQTTNNWDWLHRHVQINFCLFNIDKNLCCVLCKSAAQHYAASEKTDYFFSGLLSFSIAHKLQLLVGNACFAYVPTNYADCSTYTHIMDEHSTLSAKTHTHMCTLKN